LKFGHILSASLPGCRAHTRKTAISRLETHIQDVKLSTVEKYVKALGKRIEIKIVQPALRPRPFDPECNRTQLNATLLARLCLNGA